MRILGGAIALSLLMGRPMGGVSQALVTVASEEREAAAIELAQASLHDQEAEADRLNGVALRQFRTGQVQAAFQSWEIALRLYRETGNRRGEASVLGNLGIVYRFLGLTERAIALHNQALAIQREIGDREGQANSFGSLGNAYHYLGQYRRAIDFHNQALALEQASGAHLREAYSLGNLANAYSALGQYERAIDAYTQSLAIVQEVGDRRGESAVIGSLGLAHHLLGQYQRAIDFYNQSLVIAREIGDRRGEGTGLGNLGLTYAALNQPEHAIDFYNQSLAIAREIGDRRGESSLLGNLGSAYGSLKQYGQAIDVLNQYRTLAREIGDRRGEAIALGNLGAVYLFLGQFDRAIAFHNQSLAIARDIGHRPGEIGSLHSLGLAHGSLGRYQQAEQLMRQSLMVAEDLERELGPNDRNRISFFETIAVTYSSLTRLLLIQGQGDLALEVADRSRARSLVQFLTPSTNEQQTATLTIKQIQKLARDKNATLITYAIVAQDLYIWAVAPTGQINVVQANPEALGLPLRDASRDIRSGATFGPFNDPIFSQSQYRIDLQAVRGEGSKPLWVGSPEYLEQGYNLLIKPIENYLPTAPGSRLIIVPHRELGTIPFAALFQKGRGFLIDHYTLTVTPSLQILNTLQPPSPTATGTPLVVGNPSPMVNKLRQLPGSEAEAIAIAQKLNATPIIGEQATEATIKTRLENASLLHLATHGILQKSDHDLNSWLALANVVPNGIQDNKLTISEIFSSTLNAQLAVLSACNTNSGQISGEGVIGLARAFLKAGVPTVVASSWKVPDEQTRILMEEFYDQLLAGETYANALRAAQLKVRAQHPNPFYWAAFTVIGEGDHPLKLP